MDTDRSNDQRLPTAGIPRALDSFLRNPSTRSADIVRSVARYWGFVFAFMIVLSEVLFGGLGADQTAVTTWVFTDIFFLLLLELLRRCLRPYYDSALFQTGRILVHLAFLGWLIAISPSGRTFLWPFFVLPVFGIILYSGSLARTAVLCILAIATLGVTSSVLATASEFTVGTFVGQVAMVVLFVTILYWLYGAGVRRSQELAGIARHLHETLDLESLTDRIARTAKRLADAERALIIVVNPCDQSYLTHSRLRLNLRRGRSVEELVGECSVIQTGQPFQASDLTTRFAERSVYARYFDCEPRSLIAEPLLSKEGQILGVLSVLHDHPQRFNTRTAAELEEFTRLVVSAVENALAYRLAQLDHAARDNTSPPFAGGDDSDTVVLRSLEHTRRAIDRARGSFLLCVEDDASPPLFAVYDHRGDLTSRNLHDFGIALRRHAETSAQPTIVSDTCRHPLFTPPCAPNDWRSVIFLRLVNPDSGQIMGVIGAYSNEPDAFRSSDEIILATAASFTGTALVFAKWREQGGLINELIVQFRELNDDDEDSYEGILEIATASFDLCNTSLWIQEHRSSPLRLVASCSNAGASDDIELHESDVELLMDHQFRAEQSYLIPHDHDVWWKVSEAVRSTVLEPILGECGTGSCILLTPLSTESGQILGVITARLSRSTLQALRQRIEAMGVFASTAAWSLEQKRARRMVHAQQRQTEAFIASIGSELAQCHDREALGEVVVQVGAKLLSAEACSLFFVEREELVLTHSTYLGGTPFIGRRKRIARSERVGLNQWVAATGRILNTTDGAHKLHPAWSGRSDNLKYMPSGRCEDLLIVPIVDSTGAIVGVLNLENKGGGRAGGFDEHDAERVAGLAKTVADALSVIAHNDKLGRWEQRGLQDDLHELINWYHSGVVLPLEYLNWALHRGNFEEMKKLMPILRQQALTTVHELKAIHTTVTSEFFRAENLSHALELMVAAWRRRLQGLIREDTVPLELRVECENIDVPAEVRSTFLRVAHSALANAVFHSGGLGSRAVVIKIKIRGGNGQAILEVEDDGCGVAAQPKGYGTLRMKQLVDQLSVASYPSELDIKTSAGEGMLVRVTTKIPS